MRCGDLALLNGILLSIEIFRFMNQSSCNSALKCSMSSINPISGRPLEISKALCLSIRSSASPGKCWGRALLGSLDLDPERSTLSINSVAPDRFSLR